MGLIHWSGFFQEECYFELTQVASPQCLSLVPFFMQGSVLAWFKWLHANHLLTTWKEYTQALELRFGLSSYVNHQATLFKLQQLGSVTEYWKEFETLSNREMGLYPEAFLNYFMSGLHVGIHVKHAIYHPHTLTLILVWLDWLRISLRMFILFPTASLILRQPQQHPSFWDHHRPCPRP